MRAVDLSVVIPAYNESDRIGGTLDAVWRYLSRGVRGFEIVVVDDGSVDDTAEIVERFARDRDGIRLISYKPNRGKGYAVRTGMLDSRGELVLFSDADLATPIEELDPLIKAIEDGCDIAVASRALMSSVLVVRQPWYRQMGGRMLNYLIRWLAVPGIRDTQCGFKLFQLSVVSEVFSRCKLDDFSFDVEVLYVASKLGFVIGEVPVRWTHMSGSKVRPFRDGLRLVWSLHRIRRLHARCQGLKSVH